MSISCTDISFDRMHVMIPYYTLCFSDELILLSAQGTAAVVNTNFFSSGQSGDSHLLRGEVKVSLSLRGRNFMYS